VGANNEPLFLVSDSETDVSTLGRMNHLLAVVLQNRGFVHNSLLFWTSVRNNSLEWYVHNQHTWGLYYFIRMKDNL
jgi:hypothetical protein